MSDFILEPQDEFPHPPGPEINFNESVYLNGFDTKTGAGGWMRLGNRVNEGHAELSVCLYLPGGRIACSFRRPGIAANDRFDAGGLAYRVIEPFRSVEIRYDGELFLVDDPEALRDPQALFARGAELDRPRPACASSRNRRCTAARRRMTTRRPCTAAISRSAISTSMAG